MSWMVCLALSTILRNLFGPLSSHFTKCYPDVSVRKLIFREQFVWETLFGLKHTDQTYEA